ENIKHLGNTGHHLIVDAANDAQAEKAVQRINETAARLWPQGAGVDGLLNQYFVDLAWSGALSSEDVVNFAAKRVEKVVIVPVEQIRFTWNGEDYLPNQLPKHSLGTGRSSLGLVPLNAETYRYYAMQVLGNVPYAKPPATAALEDITGPMADGKENLKRVIQKYGLVGFAAMQVSAKPQKPNESDEEYHTRMRGYLARVLSSVQGSFSQGLLGMFRDQKLEFENVTGNAQGLKDVWEIIEAQAFNGTAMQPAFFGRVHSTTETFADVVYALLDAQATNFRRPAKRRMERTYTLDLMMGGYQFNGVSVKFNRTPSRNALRDAQAEQTKVKTVIEKAKNGIISPDQAAQELGYDAAFDPDLLSGNSDAGNALKKIKAKQSSFSAIFRFNKDWNRYEHVPDRIEVTQTKADNVIRLKKKIV
ncbi:MAG TPA: hypothetical protein VEF04_12290, partial [Blastocatellia bacterium]|nr:hypothetical protein [Blastocatellia bacterium]